MGRPEKIQLKSWEAWNWTLGLLLLLFFLSPALILVSNIIRVPFSVPTDLNWALRNTFLQAAFSGALSALAGLLAALGLCYLPSTDRRRKALELLLMGPFFLPALFSLVICLSWIDPFPFGLMGIALVHTFMNFGWVAFVLARDFERDFAGLTQLAYLEGAGKLQTLRALLWPIGQKLLASAFSVFALSFTSFTVPMIVGGGRGTTLEVLIYEKLRIEGDYSSGLMLCFLQMGMVMLISGFILRKYSQSLPPSTSATQNLLVLRSQIIFWILCGLALLVGFGIFGQVLSGFEQAGQLEGFWDHFSGLMGRSVLLAGVVAGATFLLLSIQISLGVHSWPQRILSGLLQFSPSIVAFTSLLFWGDGIFSAVMALTLIFLPGLWRAFARGHFQSLAQQVEMAYIMGASPFQTCSKIVMPQMAKTLAVVAGVAAMWTVGEFAVTKLIFAQESTLGILAGNLMASYRTKASFLVTTIILGLGLVFFYTLRLGAYVYRSKFTQSL